MAHLRPRRRGQSHQPEGGAVLRDVPAAVRQRRRPLRGAKARLLRSLFRALQPAALRPDGARRRPRARAAETPPAGDAGDRLRFCRHLRGFRGKNPRHAGTVSDRRLAAEGPGTGHALAAARPVTTAVDFGLRSGPQSRPPEAAMTRGFEGRAGRTGMAGKPRRITPDKLRSRLWFDNPDNPAMTALYIERYLNFGLTPQELQSRKPIIGVAQTGSDLSPCNRHHLELAKRVREGIVSAGGVCFEFPTHPIQETGKRPTACLDRNLAYLSLVELLYGYFLDGVVLLTGCDKTMPACLMAAATVNIPAISLNVGPMLNGWSQNERLGSGTVVWKARERHAAGDIDYQQFIDIVAGSAPSVGHCNTMGTASTMNALAEALGMSLPGSAAIPAPYRE